MSYPVLKILRKLFGEFVPAALICLCLFAASQTKAEKNSYRESIDRVAGKVRSNGIRNVTILLDATQSMLVENKGERATAYINELMGRLPADTRVTFIIFGKPRNYEVVLENEKLGAGNRVVQFLKSRRTAKIYKFDDSYIVLSVLRTRHALERKDGKQALIVLTDGDDPRYPKSMLENMDAYLDLFEIHGIDLTPELEREYDSLRHDGGRRNTRNREVTPVAFAPDHEFFLIGRPDGRIQYIHSATGRVTREFRTTPGLSKISMGPGGDTFLAAANDGQVRVFRLENGRAVQTHAPRLKPFRVPDLRFDDTGTKLVSGTHTRPVPVFDLKKNRPIIDESNTTAIQATKAEALLKLQGVRRLTANQYHSRRPVFAELGGRRYLVFEGGGSGDSPEAVYTLQASAGRAMIDVSPGKLPGTVGFHSVQPRILKDRRDLFVLTEEVEYDGRNAGDYNPFISRSLRRSRLRLYRLAGDAAERPGLVIQKGERESAPLHPALFRRPGKGELLIAYWIGRKLHMRRLATSLKQAARVEVDYFHRAGYLGKLQFAEHEKGPGLFFVDDGSVTGLFWNKNLDGHLVSQLTSRSDKATGFAVRYHPRIQSAGLAWVAQSGLEKKIYFSLLRNHRLAARRVSVASFPAGHIAEVALARDDSNRFLLAWTEPTLSGSDVNYSLLEIRDGAIVRHKTHSVSSWSETRSPFVFIDKGGFQLFFSNKMRAEGPFNIFVKTGKLDDLKS